MATEKRKPGRPKKPKVRASDIEGGKYVRAFFDVFRHLRPHGDCPNRKLHCDEFISYLLLYFFTPILTSARSIQRASTLKGVRRRMGLPGFSLGSFSEAAQVFDPELLPPVLRQLVSRAENIEVDERLANLDRTLTAVDGTLIAALPEMTWALWVDENHRAAKMHLHLDIISGVPARATVTEGNASEVEDLKRGLSSGKLYVMDRGYATYSLLADIQDNESSFVVRLPCHASYRVVEERPISKKARKEGVVSDALVRLGSRGTPALRDRVIRLVTIEADMPAERWEKKKIKKVRKARSKAKKRAQARAKREATEGPSLEKPANTPEAEKKSEKEKPGVCRILLATDLLDLDAELISLIYKYRWQVELYFRWFKKVLQADRLLFLSKNGMTLVCYVALIASLLLTLYTGKKPNKQSFEIICLFFSGLADAEDLLEHIERCQSVAK